MARILQQRDGIPVSGIHHSEYLVADAVHSMKVYPANYVHSLASARTDHHVDVPVQIIVGTRNPFVRDHVYDETGKWVARLWRRDVRAGQASMAAYAPLQSRNAYATSKAAVFMFSDCLRAELDTAGIGLTTVCPGVIDTDIVATTHFDVPEERRGAVGRCSEPLAAMLD